MQSHFDIDLALFQDCGRHDEKVEPLEPAMTSGGDDNQTLSVQDRLPFGLKLSLADDISQFVSAMTNRDRVTRRQSVTAHSGRGVQERNGSAGRADAGAMVHDPER